MFGSTGTYRYGITIFFWSSKDLKKASSYPYPSAEFGPSSGGSSTKVSVIYMGDGE